MLYSKKLFALRRDKAHPEDEQLTSSQKYGIISQKEFMNCEHRRVTVVMTGDNILKHVETGDFVISMRSFQGGIEYSRISGKISSAYVMLIPNHNLVDDRYFKWLFKSASYIKALQGTSDLAVFINGFPIITFELKNQLTKQNAGDAEKQYKTDRLPTELKGTRSFFLPFNKGYNNGAGNHYLIQHSAGSGKSNSIAWLAHQLVTLKGNSGKVFDTIIVVTDRVYLDKQIRDTIKQFMQVSNTVG